MIEKEKYFCLAADGLLYSLGECSNFDDAENKAEELKLDVVWFFGEESAQSWFNTLKEII